MYIVKEIDSTLQSPESADNKSTEISGLCQNKAKTNNETLRSPRSPPACQSAHNLQKSAADQERDTHI